MIERLLESGSLKYAEAFLNYKSKKNKERQQQLQRENMQLDAQREQEAIKLKNQMLQSEEKIKTDEAIRLNGAKKQIDEKFAEGEHQRKKELLGIEAELGMVSEATKATLDADKGKV
jgi:DNA anti-recombination protein RmuC